MSPAAESPADGPLKLDEEITAYLDGELSSDESRQFEQRLAGKEDVRQRVQTFQQSWELLDQLPHNEAGSEFAASTVELVATSADPTRDNRAESPARRWLRQGAIVGLSITAACLVGFAVTATAASLLRAVGAVEDANDRLARDLPILENLDQYELVGSLDLLGDLNRLAGDVLADGEMTLPSTREDLGVLDATARREKISDMSAADKKRLSINQERFSKYPAEKQNQLRLFHRQLAQDPQAAQLRMTLDLYYEWYKHLPHDKRAELRITPDEELVDHLARLRTEQQQVRERQRAMADVRAIARWSEQTAVKYQEQLLGGLAWQRRQEILAASEVVKRRRLTALLWQQWHNSASTARIPIDTADLQRLFGSVSPTLRQKLESAGDAQSARRVLMAALPKQYLQPLMRSGTAVTDVAATDSARATWQRVAPMIRNDSDRQRQLMDFFQNELSSQEQERLKRMPREEAMKYLQARYLRSNWKPKTTPRRPSTGGGAVAPRPQLRKVQRRPISAVPRTKALPDSKTLPASKALPASNAVPDSK